MRAIVLGLAVSGSSAAELLKRRGYQVFGVDQDPACLEAVKLPPFSGLALEPSDLVVASPGVSKEHPLYHEALRRGIEAIGEAELALREVRCPVIGVTGTNGKTTTTSLIAHVLRHAGIKAFAMGNIGRPLSSFDGGEELIVAELSSFQLEGMQGRSLDLGLLLNITPDHLDRYGGSFEAYSEAKRKIASHLKEGAPLIAAPELAASISYRPLKVFETSHREEARLACSHFGVGRELFEEAEALFKPLPHRLERLGEKDGVRIWNDSKATNVGAVIHAVSSLTGGILLIAGGLHKGASYEPWLPCFLGKVKRAFLIGEAAPRIASALAPAIPCELFASLESAVRGALACAERGDQLLLSPGCSSFDMFKDYRERGRLFQEIIGRLP